MTRSSRPAPRKSGRAPKPDPSEPPTALDCLESLTLEALRAAVFIQNLDRTPDIGPKSRYLSQLSLELELGLLQKAPKVETDRLCLSIAAAALRILEQGDGKG